MPLPYAFPETEAARRRALAELEAASSPASQPAAEPTQEESLPERVVGVDVSGMPGYGEARAATDPGLRPPPPMDSEMKAAREADRRARNAYILDLGTKQIIAGLSQRPLAHVVPAEAGNVKALEVRRRALADIEGGEADREQRRGDAEADRELRREDMALRRVRPEEDVSIKWARLQQDTREAEALNEYRRGLLAQRGAASDRQEARGKEGRVLAPTTVMELADADTAIKELDRLDETYRRLDMGTTASKFSARATDLLGLQGTDAAEFLAHASRAMQGAGAILERGKLAAGDEAKYRAMMLKAGDSLPVVKAKTEGMKRFLRDLKDGRIKFLGAAGYDVKAMQAAPQQPAAGMVTIYDAATGEEMDTTPEMAKRLIAAGKAKAKP